MNPLLLNLITKAYSLNAPNFNIFIDFYGHTNQLSITCYPHGWENENNRIEICEINFSLITVRQAETYLKNALTLLESTFQQFLIETNSNNGNNNKAKEIERTDEEIIEQTELLADEFLQIEGWEFHSKEKLRYRLNHPLIQKAWLMACRAQEVLTQTEVENCLANLENDE